MFLTFLLALTHISLTAGFRVVNLPQHLKDAAADYERDSDSDDYYHEGDYYNTEDAEAAVAWTNLCKKVVPGWCERTMRCESRTMADGVGPVYRESYDECRARFLKRNNGMGEMFMYYAGSKHCQATEGRNKRSDGNWRVCSPIFDVNGGSGMNFGRATEKPGGLVFDYLEKAVGCPAGWIPNPRGGCMHAEVAAGTTEEEFIAWAKGGDFSKAVGPSQLVKALALVGFLTTLYGAGCHFLKN